MCRHHHFPGKKKWAALPVKKMHIYSAEKKSATQM
jgi:hypothetical protein